MMELDVEGAAVPATASARGTHHHATDFVTGTGIRVPARWRYCIPKLRSGSYFPPLSGAPSHLREGARGGDPGSLCAGISTRSSMIWSRPWDDRISKSQVSRLCAEIDERVHGFLLNGRSRATGRYLWIDATYAKVREGGRIISVAVIIAIGANTQGRREVLGLKVGPGSGAVLTDSCVPHGADCAA